MFPVKTRSPPLNPNPKYNILTYLHYYYYGSYEFEPQKLNFAVICKLFVRKRTMKSTCGYLILVPYNNNARDKIKYNFHVYIFI